MLKLWATYLDHGGQTMILISLPPPVPPVCEDLFYKVEFRHEAHVYERVWTHILDVEGSGIAPVDKSGHISKYGITVQGYTQYTGKKVTAETIRNLTEEKAKRFYFDVYWRGQMIEQIKSPQVAIAVMDVLINRGPFGGAVFLQKFLKQELEMDVQVNGLMLKATIDAINAADPQAFMVEFFKYVQQGYMTLAFRDHSQMKYLRGWLLRTFRLVDLLKEF